LPGVISPQAATIRAGIVRAPIDSSVSVLDERNAWEAAAAATPLPEWATEELVEIGGVACRLVRADGVSDRAPTIVYNHGGGFVSGSSLTTRVFGARLSARTGAVVALVDYRLLPEHPFPAPLDDVVAVARACAANGRGEVLWLGGDSSGAALAIGAAIALRDFGIASVGGIVSICGAFDATLSSSSIDDADDPQLDRAQLARWLTTVAPVADPFDPMMSPIYADVRGLPPALLLAGGDDVWRDDSTRMAARLAVAGDTVELHVVAGMWHCWPVWGEFPEADAALGTVAGFMQRHGGAV
jgi:monoterpene epsilon-lactone hydrolase